MFSVKTGVLVFVFCILSVRSEEECSYKTCINLCCQKGEAFKYDLKTPRLAAHRCDPQPEPRKRCLPHHQQQLVWKPQFWEGKDQVDLKESVDFMFVTR